MLIIKFFFRAFRLFVDFKSDRWIECTNSFCQSSFYNFLKKKNDELFFSSFFPSLSLSSFFLFFFRESTVTTDLYTLARGVKLTRVGKPATLRADKCVNAERMIYPSPLAMYRVSRRFPFPTLSLDLNLNLSCTISVQFYSFPTGTYE